MALDESQIEAHPFILLQATKYYQLASALLLLYDYILTFDLEIEAVWSAKKLNFAKLLFFLNRYFPLFFYIWIVVGEGWNSATEIPRLHLGSCIRNTSKGLSFFR
ncbi:hypothetical protein PNOK_0714500 [Pyrrhoderma noxium]|uniref:DUF6533 domain-containing protein n=1 Tax=Pyrrhoderma noxium TaxID=2282107 RepID=A0A286UBW4_9AGAM|nr:hypothetical protein PNOK_0714500 [Pyrrhoderma noxium]